MRIRDRFKGTRVSPVKGVKGRPQRATPQAIRGFKRAGQTWSYTDSHVLLDGYDVNSMISEDEVTVGTLVGLASGLDSYKRKVMASPRQYAGAAHFIALVDALLEKIMGKVKKIYDDKMFGLSWKLKDNQLIVNGVNITSFLALYRVRKTDKAYRFLKGLSKKVDTIIANPSGSIRNEKARASLLRLKEAIDKELAKDKQTAMPGRQLPAGNRHP